MKNELMIEQVTHSYGDKKILSGVYLKSETGSITGLLGRNGCGKSTFLQIVFGSLLSDSATIHWNGEYSERLLEQKKAIGYLPQFPFLPKKFTVKKCIQLYFKGNEILQLFRKDEIIGPTIDQKIFSLSGGEQRYLEFLMIMNSKKEFVLLDEPFSKMAPAIVEKMKVVIKEKASSMGIILTDHVYRNVIDVSTDLYIMTNGELYPVSGTEELRNKGYLPMIEDEDEEK